VAAFRFSKVSRSYASRMGDARDVGVVGAAIFTERVVPPSPPVVVRKKMEAQPFDDSAGRSQEQDLSPVPPSATASAAPMPRGLSAFASDSENMAGSVAPKASRAAPKDRPGLGTEFGEAHGSHVDFTSFERATEEPSTVLTVRYNDHDGLIAAGIDVDHTNYARDDRWERAHADPFRRDPGYAQPPPGWSAN
jgi:hypothetical protein